MCARVGMPEIVQYCTLSIFGIVYTYTRLMVLPYMIFKILWEVRYPEAVNHFDWLIYLQSIFLLGI